MMKESSLQVNCQSRTALLFKIAVGRMYLFSLLISSHLTILLICPPPVCSNTPTCVLT